MKLHAIAFTQKGQEWQQALGVPVDRGIPVMRWARERFDSADALLFIGACGIAVRAVAPLIKDKTTDPAVLVMDEMGRHVIPILSGHIGGANALALEISRRTGAAPVITTATDVRGVPAADSWAMAHDCAIENPSAIKPVSAAALSGQQVGVAITEREIDPPFPVTLYLRPRTLVLGAGCKKGVDPDLFEQNACQFLRACGVSLLSVKALSTISVKNQEPAFARFCQKYSLPLLSYSAEELRGVPGVFAHSDFVEKTVGVDNVCERAAVRAAGGVLLAGKTAMEGMTFALAGEKNL
ncbi:MAG: cobalamin biosynthesis protein [Clostridia bacterium]|nr:cobalamin biosynthesis protein [Clostridia bacterium]